MCVVLFAKPLYISVASIKVQGSILFTLFLKLTSTPVPKICDLCCHCFYYLCQNKISDHTKPVSDKSHIFAWNNFQLWKYQNLWHRVKVLFWQVICDVFSTVRIFFQNFFFSGTRPAQSCAAVKQTGAVADGPSAYRLPAACSSRISHIIGRWRLWCFCTAYHPIKAEECMHNVHILLYYFSFVIG